MVILGGNTERFSCFLDWYNKWYQLIWHFQFCCGVFVIVCGIYWHHLWQMFWILFRTSACNRPFWCIVQQNFNLIPFLKFFFVRVIRFITNRKYAFFFIYLVKLWPDNINLIFWIKIDHILVEWRTITRLNVSTIYFELSMTL